MQNKLVRKKRAIRTRAKIRRLSMPRLTIHRTPKHIFAQVIDTAGKVVACASTVEKMLKGELANGGNVAAAKRIGQIVGTRAKEAGVTKIAFDRSGFLYHGRVKALADGARESGLEF